MDKSLRPIPGRLKLWPLLITTMLFFAIDYLIVSFIGEDWLGRQWSKHRDIDPIQWSYAFEQATAERIRSEQASTKDSERLRIAVNRLDRGFIEREERLRELEGALAHVGQLSDMIERIQPAGQPPIGWHVERLDPKKLPDSFSLIVPGLFKSGSVNFQETGVRILEISAQIMRAFPDLNVEIVGHTDAGGSEEHNLVLSRRRATAVRDYLTDHLDFPSERFTLSGRGESEPISDNGSVEGRHENRRVEFFLRRRDGR